MTIAVFGDSIAWGMVDPLRGGWVTRLRRSLEEKLPELNFYNLSIPGETSQGLLDRFQAEALPRQLQAIIFAIGINDTVINFPEQTYRVSEEQFRKNIEELLRLASLITKHIFMIGLTAVDEERTQPMFLDHSIAYGNQRIKIFNQVLKKLAAENKVRYFSTTQFLSKNELIDGLHPNADGHKTLAKKLIKELLPPLLASTQL